MGYTPSKEVLAAHAFVLSERKRIVETILQQYNKPKVLLERVQGKPLTNKEMKMFQDMGCVVTIKTNSKQQSLF